MEMYIIQQTIVMMSKSNSTYFIWIRIHDPMSDN